MMTRIGRSAFTLELTRFSGRTPERIPARLKGKAVRIERYCLYDWHYKPRIEKTIEPEEPYLSVSHLGLSIGSAPLFGA